MRAVGGDGDGGAAKGARGAKVSGAGGDGGKETETEDDDGEEHMEEEAPKKKRGRPPKASAEANGEHRGGKWVVWYDGDGNEVERKVKVGCCVSMARFVCCGAKLRFCA